MTAETRDWTDTRRSIVRDPLGVGIAVGAYALSYGAIATTSRLSVVQACATSLLIFTGASQFALIGVIAGGGTRSPERSPPCCWDRATCSTVYGWPRRWACGDADGCSELSS